MFDVAFYSLTESRVDGTDDAEALGSSEHFLDIWSNTSPLLLSGGFNGSDAEDAVKAAEAKGITVAIMFGRMFTSNPDLPYRSWTGVSLTPYNRDDFYIVKSPIGYIDQVFSTDITS